MQPGQHARIHKRSHVERHSVKRHRAALHARPLGALARTRQAISAPLSLFLCLCLSHTYLSHSLSWSLDSSLSLCLSRWDAPLITGAWRKASPEPTSASEAATAMVTRRDGIFATAIGHPASVACPCAHDRRSARPRAFVPAPFSRPCSRPRREPPRRARRHAHRCADTLCSTPAARSLPLRQCVRPKWPRLTFSLSNGGRCRCHKFLWEEKFF